MNKPTIVCLHLQTDINYPRCPHIKVDIDVSYMSGLYIFIKIPDGISSITLNKSITHSYFVALFVKYFISVNQPINHPINHPINSTTNLFVFMIRHISAVDIKDLMLYKPITQSINQSTTHSTNQSSSQSLTCSCLWDDTSLPLI